MGASACTAGLYFSCLSQQLKLSFTPLQEFGSKISVLPVAVMLLKLLFCKDVLLEENFILHSVLNRNSWVFLTYKYHIW